MLPRDRQTLLLRIMVKNSADNCSNPDTLDLVHKILLTDQDVKGGGAAASMGWNRRKVAR